jgi:hypothetical protein
MATLGFGATRQVLSETGSAEAYRFTYTMSPSTRT